MKFWNHCKCNVDFGAHVGAAVFKSTNEKVKIMKLKTTWIYLPMSKPSFTFCFRMVVEYERGGNLLGYKSGLCIFNKIFIFSFFSDQVVQMLMASTKSEFWAGIWKLLRNNLPSCGFLTIVVIGREKMNK